MKMTRHCCAKRGFSSYRQQGPVADNLVQFVEDILHVIAPARAWHSTYGISRRIHRTRHPRAQVVVASHQLQISRFRWTPMPSHARGASTLAWSRQGRGAGWGTTTKGRNGMSSTGSAHLKGPFSGAQCSSIVVVYHDELVARLNYHLPRRVEEHL